MKRTTNITITISRGVGWGSESTFYIERVGFLTEEEIREAVLRELVSEAGPTLTAALRQPACKGLTFSVRVSRTEVQNLGDAYDWQRLFLAEQPSPTPQ